MRSAVYNEDHDAFRASVREFLDREVRPHVEEYADAKALPRELWRAAGELGLLGLEIPEEYGGRLQATTGSTQSSPRSWPG